MAALIVFVVCLAGSVLPLFGSELVVVAAALTAEGPMRIALIVVAAGAQALGKTVVMAAATTGARTELAAVLRIHARLACLGRAGVGTAAVVFASALLSVPPLYATTIVCGVTRYRRVPFGLAVFAARVVRYSVLIAAIDPLQLSL